VTALSARRRHPMAAAVVVLLALLVTGGLYAMLGSAGKAEATAGAAQSQQIEKGRVLYLENCSSCHGLRAEGTSDGPTLIGVGAASVDFQVGTGRMPLAASGTQAERAPVQFKDDEIAALSAYVASLAPGPAIPTEEQLSVAEADVGEGGELFRTNCATCHNFAGRGGALTQGKYAPSLENVSARHMYEAMLTGPQAMPEFPDTSITPEQKQAIIKYVKAIQEQPDPGGIGLGRIGPVSEGIAAWLIGLGALIAVAVWIGAKST
jgi:ubiquinol-cytochrome c reductase cytochrome c subunit